jgi:phage tail sheath protein FI
MAYEHGIKILEQSTSILPPRRISASLPIVFGTAPVHLAVDGADSVNKPKLVYTYKEAVAAFAYSADWSKFTLCEFMMSQFSLFNMAPMVFVNVFDPAVHKASEAEAEGVFVGDELQLAHPDILAGTLVVKTADGLTPHVEGVDYTVDRASGLITRIEGGAILADATVTRAYDYADLSLVDSTDIIGGIDGTTGAATGLELLNDVFPRFRLVPGQVVAPGWSHDAAVAAVMTAKGSNINGHFKAISVIDIPETVTKYTDVAAHKNDNNLTDEQMVVCWPKCKLGDNEYWLSTQMAGVMCQTDAECGDIPYKSPSNERLQMTAAVVNGVEVWLGADQAAYLNGQGIVTALNFVGGWKAWGNRTGCYPAVTDPKDAFIPIRRMFNWIGNTLILTWWQKVDAPLTRRLVETVLDSNNIWFNGLAAREIILGGRVTFDETENPVTDLMDGIGKFHVFVTPPSPAREIDFIMEYDPAYLSSLF